MAIGFDKALGLHPQALQLRAARANQLANNLANAETPDYKARDFDFAQALQAVSSSSAGAAGMSSASSRAEAPASIDAAVEQFLQYRTPTQDSIDGNTVDEHHEHAEFMQNALGYQTSFTLLNGRFKGLMTAIRGE